MLALDNGSVVVLNVVVGPSDAVVATDVDVPIVPLAVVVSAVDVAVAVEVKPVVDDPEVVVGSTEVAAVDVVPDIDVLVAAVDVVVAGTVVELSVPDIDVLVLLVTAGTTVNDCVSFGAAL